jgi:hypothetical protein
MASVISLGLYRHYKGGLYVVYDLVFSKSSEALEVLYCALLCFV